MSLARFALVLAGVVAAPACSSARYGAAETGPSLTFPARFAEGAGEGADGGAPRTSAASSASTPAPSAAPSGSSEPSPAASGPLPDPPALVTADQWEYALRWTKGDLRVTGVRAVKLGRPAPTARRIGRFAFELWLGKELVERVRFDFPLLATDAPEAGKRHPLREDPEFSSGADTSQRVLVPASDRATSAVIVDRRSGARTPVPWPPTETPAPAASAAPPAARPAPTGSSAAP